MPQNGDRRCDDRYKECYRRFETIEKDLYVMNKPESGALATMKREMNNRFSELHEKVNKGFSNRPRWTVFWSVIVIFISVTIGSYGYTYRVTSAISDKYDIKYEKLVTKEDFKEFKKEILDRFSQLESKIENRR